MVRLSHPCHDHPTTAVQTPEGKQPSFKEYHRASAIYRRRPFTSLKLGEEKLGQTLVSDELSHGCGRLLG